MPLDPVSHNAGAALVRNEDRRHCLCIALGFERYAGPIATAVPNEKTRHFPGFFPDKE